MSAALAPSPPRHYVRKPNQRWSQMEPDNRQSYAERLRRTVIHLMKVRAQEQGLQVKDFAEATGRSQSWVSKINTLKTERFEALAEFATATGYSLSFYVALAEEMIEAEDSAE